MAEIAEEFLQHVVAPGMLGVSDSMKKIGKQIELAAADKITYDTILVTGETGSGKDVVARAMHKKFTSIKDKSDEVPFVHVNICAIATELLESELFGHIKGSFTNAIKDRPGLIKSAAGGVLYLDEIGDLPKTLQVKLLHFIQYRTIRAVGSDKEEKVEVKLILGTHCDLLKKVDDREFRQDLFYRIAKVIINIPPLRKRRDDIPIFIKNYLSLANGGITLTEEALCLLECYPWPGNIRQLLSVVDNAIFSLDQRCGGNGRTKEITKKDINTSIFDGNDPEKFNYLLITSNEENILLNAIKSGLTYEAWKRLYQRLLLLKIPGTIVFKSQLCSRPSIYRWEKELGINSVEFPKEEVALEEEKESEEN